MPSVRHYERIDTGETMGLIADTFRAFIPQTKAAIAATVPTWDQGRAVYADANYERYAREGYMLDEIVFDCVELRATSAGEPPLVVYAKGNKEKIDDHPAITLLNKPNPFMGRAEFIGTVGMHLDVAGNAYVEKVRSAAGKVVELWPLRPDRMRVVPDSNKFIQGYRYTIGTDSFTLPAEDVVRLKTRHPLNDYYGLPPLAVLAGRVDLDVWTRRFAESFFRNAGVPAGLMNIVRVMNEADREAVRRRFRDVYGGTEGWHRLLVLDGGQATYTPMGLPLGENGLALGELNRINETRIMGVFGVLPSLIASMSGLDANRGRTAAESDRALFWESTMVPWFREFDSALTTGLVDEWPELSRMEHDLSVVKALQEDEDKKHARWRANLATGAITVPEFRTNIGLPEKPVEPGTFYVPINVAEIWSDDAYKPPVEPVQPALEPPPGADNNRQPALAGSRNGAAH